MRTPVSVGIVGLGAWAAGVARSVDDLPQTEVRWLCDRNPAAQIRWRSRYPGAYFTCDFEDLLNDELLDVVVLGTPVTAHYRLAGSALEADKHVFLKRVLALRRDNADDLIRQADRGDRRLTVANSALAKPSTRKLRELIETGRLGDIYYLNCIHHDRRNLRHEEDVVWRSGADVVSLILHILRDEPIAVVARGDTYVRTDVLDAGMCYLRFANGISSAIHLSVLEPKHAVRLTVVGSKCSVTVDESRRERALTMFDPNGDIICPRLSVDESVAVQWEQFIHAVRSPRAQAVAPREAATVVSVLEAIHSSIKLDAESGVAPDRHGRAASVIRLPARPA